MTNPNSYNEESIDNYSHGSFKPSELPFLGFLDAARSLTNHATEKTLNGSLHNEGDYMVNDETSDTSYIPEDGESGSNWVRLSFGELLETVTLLNSIIGEVETAFPPEAIVEIAVHNYKIAESLHSTLNYIYDAFTTVEGNINEYMLEKHPDEWKEYDKIIEEYEQIQDSVVQAVNHYKGLDNNENHS
tara:strand:+ start:1474 stop:2037 length:564 start_codon:yes stop_codon:yes gene_type:complete